MAVTGPRALVYLVFGSLVGNGLAFVAMLRMRPIRNRQLIVSSEQDNGRP